MLRLLREAIGSPGLDLELPFPDDDRALPEGKNYHVYFASCYEDESFVIDRLKALESSPYNLKCCIPCRDFLPGSSVSQCIFQSMKKSLTVVIVLSPDYLNSGWGTFEINSAIRISVTQGVRVVYLVHKFCPIPDELKTLNSIKGTRAKSIEYRIAEVAFNKRNSTLFKRMNTSREAVLAELRSQSQADSSEIRSLTTEVIRLENENSSLKKTVATLTDEKSKVKETVNVLQPKSDDAISMETDAAYKALTMKYEELQVEYTETLDEKNRLEYREIELLAICDDYLSQRALLEDQLDQLTESESSLRKQHAALIETNKELMCQKPSLEKISEIFQVEAEKVSMLCERVRCQESCLVEKTQRILTLETSLNCVRETTKKADEICTRLEPLQAIPGLVSTRCEALSLQIMDTTDKLYDRVNSSSTQLLEKMNALTKTWIKFQTQDTSDEILGSTNSFRSENIPTHLKAYVQLLRDTVGPNWLDVGRALGLEGDQLERLWVDWGQYGMRELTVRVIECWWANCPESDIGLDVLKNAMARLEINPFTVEPMCEDDKRRLRANYEILVRDMMDVTHIESYLRQAEILSASALDYVLYPSTCHRRIKRLLKTLPFCGCRALQEFQKALMESGQMHLASALAGEQATTSERKNLVDDRIAKNIPNYLEGLEEECIAAKKRDDKTTTVERMCEIPEQTKRSFAGIKSAIYMYAFRGLLTVCLELFSSVQR